MKYKAGDKVRVKQRIFCYEPGEIVILKQHRWGIITPLKTNPNEGYIINDNDGWFELVKEELTLYDYLDNIQRNMQE